MADEKAPLKGGEGEGGEEEKPQKTCCEKFGECIVECCKVFN